MARPTILNEELIEEICDWISKGNTFYRACILCNISEASFYEWKKRGNEELKNGEETVYTEFIESVKKAEEKFKAWNVAQIMKASQNGTWQSSAWLLERKYPDEFGRREKIELTNKIDELIDSFNKIDD